MATLVTLPLTVPKVKQMLSDIAVQQIVVPGNVSLWMTRMSTAVADREVGDPAPASSGCVLTGSRTPSSACVGLTLAACGNRYVELLEGAFVSNCVQSQGLCTRSFTYGAKC